MKQVVGKRKNKKRYFAGVPARWSRTVESMVLHSSVFTQGDHLGYVRNPRSLMEGTEMLCRDNIGDLPGSPNHL